MNRVKGVKLSTATVADIPAMMEVEQRCETAPHWTKAQYERLFSANRHAGDEYLVLVAEKDSEVQTHHEPDQQTSSMLGLLVAHRVHTDWELENVVVKADFRRKGIASKLFGELLRHARETGSEAVFLEVRDSNDSARAAYGKWGFSEVGRRKSYYSNPIEDAVLYRFSLR